MTIEQVFEKAIAGGLKEGEKWKYVTANRYWVVWIDGNGADTTISTSIYFLDPKFWQALGNMQGYVGNPVAYSVHYLEEPERIPYWQYAWCKFIDHLAAEKTAESFFESLS